MVHSPLVVRMGSLPSQVSCNTNAEYLASQVILLHHLSSSATSLLEEIQFEDNRIAPERGILTNTELWCAYIDLHPFRT